MNINHTATLSLITSLYEQLATAHAEIDRLAAQQAQTVPSQSGPPASDPHDGPR